MAAVINVLLSKLEAQYSAEEEANMRNNLAHVFKTTNATKSNLVSNISQNVKNQYELKFCGCDQKKERHLAVKPGPVSTVLSQAVVVELTGPSLEVIPKLGLEGDSGTDTRFLSQNVIGLSWVVKSSWYDKTSRLDAEHQWPLLFGLTPPVPGNPPKKAAPKPIRTMDGPVSHNTLAKRVTDAKSEWVRMEQSFEVEFGKPSEYGSVRGQTAFNVACEHVRKLSSVDPFSLSEMEAATLQSNAEKAAGDYTCKAANFQLEIAEERKREKKANKIKEAKEERLRKAKQEQEEEEERKKEEDKENRKRKRSEEAEKEKEKEKKRKKEKMKEEKRKVLKQRKEKADLDDTEDEDVDIVTVDVADDLYLSEEEPELLDSASVPAKVPTNILDAAMVECGIQSDIATFMQTAILNIPVPLAPAQPPALEALASVVTPPAVFEPQAAVAPASELRAPADPALLQRYYNSHLLLSRLVPRRPLGDYTLNELQEHEAELSRALKSVQHVIAQLINGAPRTWHGPRLPPL